MNPRVRWRGPAVVAAARSAAARGMLLAAEHVLAESRKRVPIAEGTLERSGAASVDEQRLTSAVSYDTPYAVRVHENLPARPGPHREVPRKRLARGERHGAGVDRRADSAGPVVSYTADLLDGLARLLAEQNVGTYRPDGRYAPGETALTIAAVPPAPDRVICLTAYPVQDSPALTDCLTGIQVRTRAGTDPREVDVLDDAAFDVLHGAGPHTWGAARVQLLYRTASAPIGADDAGRMERTSTYFVRAHRAARHLE